MVRKSLYLSQSVAGHVHPRHHVRSTHLVHAHDRVVIYLDSALVNIHLPGGVTKARAGAFQATFAIA